MVSTERARLRSERLWTGERKGETGEHQLFAFLTTLSNDIVRPIHAKAIFFGAVKPDACVL
jgi:putative SOS response-associated peptidase YedK